MEAKDGVAEVEFGNDRFKATLEGLDNGDVLALKSADAANTQSNRLNDVEMSGNTITQKSNNGKHAIGVILEADGEEILDKTQVLYTLEPNGNSSMTVPERFSGKDYTYVLYMKYKNGDYTADDVTTKTVNKKLIVPGKGSVDLTFVLQAKEYIAD